MLKKVTVKVYSEKITNCILSQRKDSGTNSHDDVVYVPKKIRKVEVPEERLFCETEAFPKEIMVSVVIVKAGKTSTILLTKYKGSSAYCSNPVQIFMQNLIPSSRNSCFLSKKINK